MPFSHRPVAVIRNDYTSTAVTTSAYVTLSASFPQDCLAYMYFDSSSRTLKLAVGAAGSEVDLPQYILPGGQDSPVPIHITKGQRLSIKAVDATANTGQLVMNFYA